MILALIRGILPSIRTVERDRKWGDSERGEGMHQRVTGEFKPQEVTGTHLRQPQGGEEKNLTSCKLNCNEAREHYLKCRGNAVILHSL